MLPTRRFLFLIALGLVPAVGAVWLPVLFPISLGYFVVCCAFMLGNYLFGAAASDVVVRRVVKPRLSLGERETVSLCLQNMGRWRLRLAVMDTVPPGWSAEELPQFVTLRPGHEVMISYHVTPDQRGQFQFGDVHLRIRHWPDLAVRQVRVPLATEVRIYPDLREVQRYELLTRRSRAQELGFHRSRLAGRGTEFERLRDYTPDDEYRQVDWKATARRSRPMSRVYEVERSQNVFLVLDAGRMMAGRVGKLTKLEYAVNAALMLAHVALKGGDRVGLLVVSDSVDSYLPLGKGSGQFQRCLEMLYSVPARLCHVDYRGAIEQIAVRCRRRSLVVFFTDLMDEDTASELITYLRLLRPTHLPLCVTLQDPEVVAASRQPSATAVQMYERTAAIDVLNDRRTVRDRLQKLGAIALDVPPEELTVAVVNQYLELKCRQML